MPGENRGRSLRQTTQTSGATTETTTPSSKASELEVRTRGGSMIPLPRAMPQNPKTVKTEKNRLKLIMENSRGLADTLEKERRINVDEDEEKSYRVSSVKEPATPRYCDLSCNVYRCPVRKVILPSVRISSLLFVCRRSSMKIESNILTILCQRRYFKEYVR